MNGVIAITLIDNKILGELQIYSYIRHKNAVLYLRMEVGKIALISLIVSIVIR
jgi:hypothetical protein